MSEMIKFFNENECPYCSSNLALVDIDITVSQISHNGMMMNGKSSNQIYLYCNNCNRKYEVEKKGQFVRIRRKAQIPVFENPLYDK